MPQSNDIIVAGITATEAPLAPTLTMTAADFQLLAAHGQRLQGHVASLEGDIASLREERAKLREEVRGQKLLVVVVLLFIFAVVGFFTWFNSNTNAKTTAD